MPHFFEVGQHFCLFIPRFLA